MHAVPEDAVHTFRLAAHNHVLEKYIDPDFREVYRHWVGGKGTGQSIMYLC